MALGIGTLLEVPSQLKILENISVVRYKTDLIKNSQFVQLKCKEQRGLAPPGFSEEQLKYDLLYYSYLPISISKKAKIPMQRNAVL